MNKTCSKCAISKPISAFRIAMKRGQPRYRAECVDCESEYYRSQNYRCIANQKNSRYRALGRDKSRERRHARHRYEQYPQKDKAKRAVRRALERGELIKPTTCDNCGATPDRMRDGRTAIQAHHDYYGKPLVVRWLCHVCHIQVHRARASKEKDDE